MKKSKTSGKFGIVIDMLLALGDSGLERITSLFNCILQEKRIPSKWDTGVIVICFEHEGKSTERLKKKSGM